jgi:excinuclease ABC subunit A
MSENFIKIRGARVHNLQNINVDIPKNKLVVITGLSGSGKSSLAFDTLYAEGQRRYLESLSAYARQFLGVMQKPDVDKIEGISPSIAIDQRKASHNPRSTVGTITEIYDYLRLLFARVGEPRCPKCGKLVSRQTVDQIARQIKQLPQKAEIAILGPVVRGKKGEHSGVLEEIKRAGFARVRIDNIIWRLEEALTRTLDKKKKHNIEVVVDRLVIDKGLDKSRLADSLETALKLGKGVVVIQNTKYKIQDTKTKSVDLVFSEHFACEQCGVSLPEIEPRLFSFNSPFGACPSCQGLGEKLEVDPKLVIPNPNLTLGEGAIFPWAHASHKIGRQGFFWWRLQELAERHKFSLDVPVKELSKETIDLILYGEKSKTKNPNSETLTTNYSLHTAGFEGVIPWLERRYHETDSDWARQEIEQYMVQRQCEVCQGKRLRSEALAVKIAEKSIADVVSLTITEIKTLFLSLLDDKLNVSEKKVAQPIIKEILNRLQFLVDVGLDYLALERQAATLAGGEEQRIRLATQLGSQLTGVIYILDEPSIGLHPRDQGRLIASLKKLRDLGNTVVVVEHDPQTIRQADYVIDVGPGAGKHGGRVTFTGTPKQLLQSHTLTGDYLAGRKKVEVESVKRKAQSEKQQSKTQNYLIVKGAKEHNLKNIDVKIPLAKFVCVTGVSGSGKSSLVNDILARALLKKFYRAKETPGSHETISGTEFLNKVVLVDQSAIGRTPRSNPATYTGAFSYIRDLFANTKEAKIRGYGPGRFSFNVKGGRCEQCEGQGEVKIEMYFLPDLYQECQECHGQRFNQETLAVEYIPLGQGEARNIAQVLKMTIEEATEFFKNIPGLLSKLKTMQDVGLGYLELGQPAPSLSGGEAQRIKLAAELSRRDTGKTLYILDEPTTGLHFEDIKKLLAVLRQLVEKGNTVLIIEHNLDIIRNADFVIDLGPEGGEKGGEIVALGTPQEIAKNKKSYTGQYLKNQLG